MCTLCTLPHRYHQLSEDLQKQYLSPDNADGNEPVPMSALMNGVGQGSCRGSKCNYPVLPAVAGSCTEAKTQVGAPQALVRKA